MQMAEIQKITIDSRVWSNFEVELENWIDIRYDIMNDCLIQKYKQEPYRTKLLMTGNQHIEEGNAWGDVFWGVDIQTREGLNILGELIMEIRDDLRDEN